MYHWLIHGERQDKTPVVGFVHSSIQDPLLYFLFFFVGTEEGNSAPMTDMDLVGHDGGSTGSWLRHDCDTSNHHVNKVKLIIMITGVVVAHVLLMLQGSHEVSKPIHRTGISNGQKGHSFLLFPPPARHQTVV